MKPSEMMTLIRLVKKYGLRPVIDGIADLCIVQAQLGKTLPLDDKGEVVDPGDLYTAAENLREQLF